MSDIKITKIYPYSEICLFLAENKKGEKATGITEEEAVQHLLEREKENF